MKPFKPYIESVVIDVKKIRQAGKLIYEAMGYDHSKSLGKQYFTAEIMYKIVGNECKGKIDFK